jgi:hypothetical protein
MGEIGAGKYLVNACLEDQERNERITLDWLLGR